MAKIANEMIDKRAELKRITLTRAAAGVDYSGVCVSLSDITQGDTPTTRDGNSVVFRELKLRYTITPADATNLMRVIVFRWLPLDSTPPTPGQILLTIGSALAPLSVRYPVFPSLYKVYYNKLHDVDTTSKVQVKGRVVIRKKMGIQKTEYNNTSSDGVGKLYILAISDSAAATHPSIQWYGQLRYNDM
jgi:hypothetical protein